MQAYGPVQKRGFTLVELLTVVAIIALLIGLLVPTVGKVRDHAKRASVQTMLEVLGKGCETFQKDFDRYPASTGGNPFEGGGYDPTTVILSGAQWLILELSGADLKGYIAQDKDHYYDSQPFPTGDGRVNQNDWKDWYSLTPSKETFHRWGPYVQLDGKTVQTPENYAAAAGLTLPDRLTPGNALAGTSDFSNGKLPVAVDAFGFPVLYYAANGHAKYPYTDRAATPPVIGRYDQFDNAGFTGSELKSGVPGFDLGGGPADNSPTAGKFHYLYELGWSAAPANANLAPTPQTFADKFYDRDLFQQKGGGTGKVWPYRPDTFLLISAGKDGIFGTSDDVTNF